MGVQIIYTGKRPQQMLKDFMKMKSTIMTLAANEAVNFVADNFRMQGFDTGMGVIKWPPRNPEAKRNDRPILVDSGKLKNGIRKTIQGNVIIISVAPPADEYAAVHNEGYEGTQEVHSKRGHTFSRKMKIPERRFIGDSLELNKRIYRLVDREMLKVFN